jgi:hypothetical protein
MPKDIQTEYEKLSKKYKLPKYHDMDLVFEISTIENTNFLLRNIIGKIIEKTEYHTKFLEEFIQPDAASLSGMHEIRFFSDDEKHKIYILYKKLMKLNRNAVEVDLSQEEGKEADFILNAFNTWQEMKDELLSHVKKMKECWEKETNMEEELGYLG